MPKIPNWSKEDPSKKSVFVQEWEHDSDKAGVSIAKKPFKGGGAEYDVIYMWDKPNGGVGRRKLNVGMDTKESARTFAVFWMKDHPNPKETR